MRCGVLEKHVHLYYYSDTSKAVFIEFSLGGQCPKRALKMVKKGSLRIINDYLHNP